jgi:hypothetical protein
MLVNPAAGYVMSRKHFPRMALIRPLIDEELNVMRVRAGGMAELIISLEVFLQPKFRITALTTGVRLKERTAMAS